MKLNQNTEENLKTFIHLLVAVLLCIDYGSPFYVVLCIIIRLLFFSCAIWFAFSETFLSVFHFFTFFFFSVIVTVWFSVFCLLIPYPETGICHCLWPIVLTSFQYSATSLRTSVSFPLILKSICCTTVQNLISAVSHVCFIC